MGQKEQAITPTLADCVREDEKNGLITIATIDGFQTCKFDDFFNQPLDGLLYDLNIDKATLLTMLSQDDQQEAAKWVNRYATMRVIKYLISLLEKVGECIETGKITPKKSCE